MRKDPFLDAHSYPLPYHECYDVDQSGKNAITVNKAAIRKAFNFQALQVLNEIEGGTLDEKYAKGRIWGMFEMLFLIGMVDFSEWDEVKKIASPEGGAMSEELCPQREGEGKLCWHDELFGVRINNSTTDPPRIIQRCCFCGNRKEKRVVGEHGQYRPIEAV